MWFEDSSSDCCVLPGGCGQPHQRHSVCVGVPLLALCGTKIGPVGLVSRLCCRPFSSSLLQKLWLVTQHCLNADRVQLLQPTTRSLSRVRQAQRPCRPLHLQTSSLTQQAERSLKKNSDNHEPQAARRKRSPGLPPQLEGLRPATAVRTPHLFLLLSAPPNLSAFQPPLSSLHARGRSAALFSPGARAERRDPGRAGLGRPRPAAPPRRSALGRPSTKALGLSC